MEVQRRQTEEVAEGIMCDGLNEALFLDHQGRKFPKTRGDTCQNRWHLLLHAIGTDACGSGQKQRPGLKGAQHLQGRMLRPHCQVSRYKARMKFAQHHVANTIDEDHSTVGRNNSSCRG